MTAHPLDPHQPPAEDDVVKIDGGTSEARPVTRFSVDDDDTVLVATRPKDYLLLTWARAEFTRDDEVQLRALDDFLEQTMDPVSLDYLRGRLSDPRDNFDVAQVRAIKDQLMGLWYRSPTGGRNGSSASPTMTGKPSRPKRRGKASTSEPSEQTDS